MERTKTGLPESLKIPAPARNGWKKKAEESKLSRPAVEAGSKRWKTTRCAHARNNQ